MKIRTDFVTNSSSQSYIAISIKNPELARLCKEYKIDLRVKGDTVSYKYDDFEGWPYAAIPEAGDFVDWFLHFIKDEDVADYIACEQIELNRKEIEDAFIKSTIVVSHIDEEEGFYWEERRTKDEIELKGFDDRSWKNVWDSVSHDEIAELYDGYNVEFISPDNYSLREMISDAWGIQSRINDDVFFKRMMDRYGTIHISMNEKGPEKSFINPELDFYKNREVNPMDIDFAGKTVCLGYWLELEPSDKVIERFSKVGGVFSFAKRIIEELGGKATKSVSGNTDYIAVQEEMHKRFITGDPIENKNRYGTYCKFATLKKNEIIECDKKRKSKGKPEICAILENELYVWLQSKCDEIDI